MTLGVVHWNFDHHNLCHWFERQIQKFRSQWTEAQNDLRWEIFSCTADRPTNPSRNCENWALIKIAESKSEKEMDFLRKMRWTLWEKWDGLCEKNEMNFMTKKMRWTLWKNEMDFVRKIRWTVLVKWDGLCEKNQMDFISKMRWTFWEKLDGLCEKNEINFFEEKNEMDFVRKMRWILWRKKWDGLY